MGHLVWWINADLDGEGTYSVVPHHGFLPYEEGAKKGMHELPKNMKKLLEKGKPLNARQQEMADSLSLLNELALQVPEEREHPRSSFHEEDYWGLEDEEEPTDFDAAEGPPEEEEELDEDEELLDSPSESHDKKKSKEKKKGKKRKKSPMDDEDEDEIVYDSIEEATAPFEKKKKKDKIKKKKKRNKEETDDNFPADAEQMAVDESVVAPVVEPPPAAKAPQPMEDVVEEDPSVSADSALEDSDYGGDDHGGDELAEPLVVDESATGTKKKIKKLVKKGAKDKDMAKDDDKDQKKKKKKKKDKAPKEPKKRTKAAEQRDLERERCEEEYLPLVDDLKFHKEARDIESIQVVLHSLLPVADSFAASFFSEYEIPKLMKATKTVLEESGGDTSTYRRLWNKMKASYQIKVGQLPEGFKAKKGRGAKSNDTESSEKIKSEDGAPKKSIVKEESQPQGTQVERSASNESGPDSKDSSAATPGPLGKVPSKEPHRRSSADSEQLAKTIEKSASKPKPKKFSVMDFMAKKKENKSVPSSAPDKVSTSSAGGAASKKALPAWVTSPPTSEDPLEGDAKREDRSFALEFLLQAAAHFPSNSRANKESIARSLEIAIYEWSESQGGDWNETYWNKVHSIVAAITGKREIGTLVTMIIEGCFASPKSIVTLSLEELEKSFEGRDNITSSD